MPSPKLLHQPNTSESALLLMLSAVCSSSSSCSSSNRGGGSSRTSSKLQQPQSPGVDYLSNTEMGARRLNDYIVKGVGQGAKKTGVSH